MLGRLGEQARLRLLAQAFERGMAAKAVAALVEGALGDLVEVNAALCDLVGHGRDELLGRSCAALFDAADRPPVVAALAALARDERRELVLDGQLRRHDGGLVPVTIRATVIHDALGGAHVAAEFAARTTAATAPATAPGGPSEALLDAIVSATPDLLLVSTPEGRVVRANDSWERLLGWTEADLQGMDVTTLIHPDDVATAAAGGKPATGLRNRYRTRGGDYLWLQWNGAALPGQDLVVGIARDVTAAVEAQRHAERETARLRTTIAVQREVTAAADDRATVLRLMAERTLQVIPGGDAAVVALLDADGAALQVAAGTGTAGADEPRIPVNGSLSGLAILTGSTQRCDDTRADERISAAVSAAVGVRALIVAPLLGVSGPLGVLLVSSPAPGAFNDADEQQLTLLADALAGALRHADDAARNQALLRATTAANAQLQAQRGEALAAVERLEHSERRFADVFDHSPVAKVVVGLRGADRGRITLSNPAFARLLGYSAGEAAALTVTDLLAEPSAALDQALTALADGRASRAVRQSVLRHRDGHRIEVATHTSVITDARGPASAVLQMLDVSAERAAARSTEREFQRLRDTLLVQREVTAAAADRDSAIRVVADRAVQLFPAADGAVVELLDGDALYYAATAGTLGRSLGTRVPVVGSLSGTVLATGAPAACADTSDDPRVNRATCARLGIGSMLIAPLLAGDTVIGALKVSAVRPRAFDDTDEQQLALLADSLSSALRHADDAAHSAELLAERTRALAALEVSETRFKLAFDNSPLGVVLASLDPGQVGRYLHANAAMAAITGYSTAELMTMTFRDLQHPDDVASTDGLTAQLLSGERETLMVERRYRHKDGRTIWANVHVAIVREHGIPRYLVNQVEDVTQRRAELAQLHRQATLLQLIPAAVIVRGLDGRIVWWNQGAEDLYGWPLAAATGEVTHELLATGFPDGGTETGQTAALLRDGRWEGQLKHVTAAGRTVIVLSRQVLQHDDRPGLAGTVLEVNTDVTAERAAEDALAASEARFRAQFHNSAVGQIVRNLDGSLAEVNAAYAAMLGYTPEQLLGTNSMHSMHPADLPAVAARLDDLLAGRRAAFTLEGRIRHARGHWVDVEASVTLVRDAHGRPDHFIGVVTDVTRRRAAERARDAAATELADRNTELEDANRLKLDLIGMLGHEIGNPLAAILGYTEIFLDDWAALNDARKTKIITGISRQAHRLDDIVQEVLTMVRIDAGAIHAHREPVRLHEQIHTALTAAGADVPILGPSVDALVNAGHLQHILTNLISNAGKYGGGAMAVRVVDPGDGRVQIRVEDEGPGVPDEFRDRLFQRLARADRDASRVKGTGLGLYIVHSLVRANGGDVHYEPNPGGGSVFVVTLEAPDP